MKFRLVNQDHNAGMLLEAIPDAVFDGQPKIGRLVFDSIVANTSPDHIAISTALVFGDYIGHEIHSEKPISRMTGEAIQEFLDGRRVSIQNFTDTPRSPWPSAGLLEVNQFSQLPDFETTKRGEVHGHQIFFADGTLFNGAIGSPHQSVVASNFRVFAELNEISLAKILVALGVLFSRDLHMRTVKVPRLDLTDSDCEKISNLVRAADLNIQFS